MRFRIRRTEKRTNAFFFRRFNQMQFKNELPKLFLTPETELLYNSNEKISLLFQKENRSSSSGASHRSERVNHLKITDAQKNHINFR